MISSDRIESKRTIILYKICYYKSAGKNINQSTQSTQSINAIYIKFDLFTICIYTKKNWIEQTFATALLVNHHYYHYSSTPSPSPSPPPSSFNDCLIVLIPNPADHCRRCHYDPLITSIPFLCFFVTWMG